MRENGWRDDRIAALADITGTTNYPHRGLPARVQFFRECFNRGLQARVLHRSSWAVTPVDKEDSPFNNGFREGSIIPRNRYSRCYRRKTIRVREPANRWIYYDISTFKFIPLFHLPCSSFALIFYLYTTVFDKLDDTKNKENERPILLTTYVRNLSSIGNFRSAKKEFSRELMPLLNDQV